MSAVDGRVDPVVPPGLVPPGTTELGIDIIKVERIAASLAKFGDRFTNRVLTPHERAHVRGRAETMAGRWAAKEAVSKVLGLGVRGIGWRDIEIERLPTGQPSVRLHGRAAARATQLGMDRVAVSISHESDYAIAVATRSSVYDKIISNVMEGRARDARVIAVATVGDEQIERFADEVCWVPDTHEALGPVLAVIPLQLFAYHMAVARGTDVDQPRNLAKSVTVE